MLLDGEKDAKMEMLSSVCIFNVPWVDLLWACHGIPPAEHTVGPLCCAIDLKITGLHIHTICSANCKTKHQFYTERGALG